MKRIGSCYRRGLLALACGVTCWAFSLDVRANDHPAELVLKAEQQRIQAIRSAQQASISVFARGSQGGGSGVVITPDGYALTNYHVSRPAGNYMQCSMPDGRLYDAVIVGIDPTGDVALIQLLGRDDFPHADIGDSDTVRVGDWCFAVGNPFLLATNFQPTVTFGIVSGVHRYQYPAGTLLEYADCIQTDASINPGNSGGPLFNAQGQLIGINGRGSFEKRGRVNVGVGYAISINQIKNFLGYLKSGRVVDHATLGATVSSDEDGRVVVTNILESSDAYRRGLRYGDEIIRFADRSISTVNELKNVLGTLPRGWRVPVSYRRDGERRDILVRLAGVHSQEELLEKISGRPKIEPPQPKKDEEKPRKDDRPRMPIPHGRHAARAAVPQHVQQFIQVRKGFANYYFNQLQRDRVWDSCQQKGDFSQLRGEWTIRARSATGQQVELVLGPEKSWGVFPDGSVAEVDASGDLETQLEPPGTGGLMLALHFWRRLLTLGPQRYGDAFYLGTAPIYPSARQVDVLVATYQVTESRFMFKPNGRLAGLEMYPDLNVDPCEIYFSQYAEEGDRWLPHRLQVRHGDRIVWDLQLEQFELSKAAENEA